MTDRREASVSFERAAADLLAGLSHAQQERAVELIAKVL